MARTGRMRDWKSGIIRACHPWPPVVSDGRVVCVESPDVLNFNPVHLGIGCGSRFPQDLLAYTKVASLLDGKVLLDEPAVSTAVVVKGASQVLAHVDLAVRIGNLVDNFH